MTQAWLQKAIFLLIKDSIISNTAWRQAYFPNLPDKKTLPLPILATKGFFYQQTPTFSPTSVCVCVCGEEAHRLV
jgi:hypothetical protein